MIAFIHSSLPLNATFGPCGGQDLCFSQPFQMLTPYRSIGWCFYIWLLNTASGIHVKSNHRSLALLFRCKTSDWLEQTITTPKLCLFILSFHLCPVVSSMGDPQIVVLSVPYHLKVNKQITHPQSRNCQSLRGPSLCKDMLMQGYVNMFPVSL